LLQGLNVLHVTHENSQEETEDRYDRAIGGLKSKDLGNNPAEIFYIDKATGQLRSTIEQRPSVLDPKARVKAREVMRRFGGRLIIKKYPPLTCDMVELERYLDYLEKFEGFVPDVFINDYPDICKPLDSKMSTRDSLNQIYMYHKRFGDERNMLVIVPSQATREAIRAKRLRMKDFAEDIRKLANVDTCIGVCQTDTQANSSVATLFVVAARTGKMDIGCGIVLNLDIGQFATESFIIKNTVSVADEESQSDTKKKDE
jgi:hypothetical protein